MELIVPMALDRTGRSIGIGCSNSTGCSNGTEPFLCRSWKNPMADHLPMGFCPPLLWGHGHFHIPRRDLGALPPSSSIHSIRSSWGFGGLFPTALGSPLEEQHLAAWNQSVGLSFPSRKEDLGLSFWEGNRKRSPEETHCCAGKHHQQENESFPAQIWE